MKRTIENLSMLLYQQTLPREARGNPYGKAIIELSFETTIKLFFKSMPRYRKIWFILSQ